MNNRSKTMLVSLAAVAALIALSSACSPNRGLKPTGTLTGHDTPIVVQGGSLWIWSSVNFMVPSSTGNVSDFEYVLPQNDQYVDNISVYSDQFLKNQTASIPITAGTPWTLCGNPHDIKIWSPNTKSGADAINFASAVPGNSLPIFWPMQFGRGSGIYGYGRRHVNPVPLTALNLNTGYNYQCPTGTPSDCSTSAPPCSIKCGQCFIKLNY